MTGDNQRYALQLRRDAVEKFVVKLLDGLHDGRTGLIIQSDQVWKTRRSWVGDMASYGYGNPKELYSCKNALFVNTPLELLDIIEDLKEKNWHDLGK